MKRRRSVHFKINIILTELITTTIKQSKRMTGIKKKSQFLWLVWYVHKIQKYIYKCMICFNILKIILLLLFQLKLHS